MSASGPDFRMSVGSTLDGSVTANFAAFEKAGIRAGEGAARGLGRAAREVSGIEGNLLRASHALEVFQGPLGGVASRLSASARLFSVAGAGFAGTLSAIAGGGAGLFAASDIQNQQVRLKSLAGSQQAYNVAQTETLRIAKETRSSLGDTIKLYSRLLINAQQYGLTQKQVGSVTRGVNITSQLQGLSTQESQASLNELTHALASNFQGVGQPLRLLARESPLLIKTIIDGLKKLNVEGFDGTIEGFRKFAAEGKLSSELIAQAFEVMQSELQNRLNASQVTLTQSVTGLKTSLSAFVIKLEETTHVLASVGNGITFLGDHLSDIGAIATVAGGALAARFIGPLISAGIEFVRFRAFLIAGTAAMAEISIASSVAGFGLQGLKSAAGGVVALFGGPWGVALAAAAGAVYFLSNRQDIAKDTADRMGVGEDELAKRVAATTGVILKQNGALDANISKLNTIAQAQARKGISESKDEQKTARSRLVGALQATGSSALLSDNESSNLNRLILGNGSAKQIETELGRLSGKYKDFADSIVSSRGYISTKFGLKSVYDTFQDVAIADTGAAAAQKNLQDIGKTVVTPTAHVNGDKGVAKVIADDQARVNALAKSGESLQLAAAKHKLAVDQLNKEFKGSTEKGEIEGDRAADYEARKQAIEDSYASEVQGIKAAAAAKRAASKEANADQREQKKIDDVSRSSNDFLAALRNKYGAETTLRKQAAAALLDIGQENERRTAVKLPEFTKDQLAEIKDGIARSILKPLADANALEQAQIGIVNEQLAGREANAEALKRGYDFLKAGVALQDINLSSIRDQVVAETKRNEQLALRNQLNDVYTKSFGQVQSAFTSLFSGGGYGNFAKQISSTFRNAIGEKLSISLFGNAEQEAKDKVVNALDHSSDTLAAAQHTLAEASAYRDGSFSKSVSQFGDAVDRFGGGSGSSGGQLPGADPSFYNTISDSLSNTIAGSTFTGNLSESMQAAFRNPITSPLASNDNIAAGLVPGVAGSGVGILAQTLNPISKGFAGLIGNIDRTTTDKSGQHIGSLGAGLGKKFGTGIGDVIDSVFGQSVKDGNGKIISGAGKLGQTLGKAGEAIGAAYEGYQLGQSAAGILGIPKNTGAQVGSAVGAVSGAIGGFLLAGPIGAAIGAAVYSFVGSVIGSIFGGVNPRAFAKLSVDSTGTATSNGTRARGTNQAENLNTANSEASSYIGALNSLASTFNATLKPNTHLGEIGVYGGKYGFHSGIGDDNIPTQTFDTAEKAVAAAIQFAIQQGAFEGLRAGTARLLSTGTDFNAQSNKASKYEQVFNDVAKATNPAAYAVKTLNTQFTNLAAIFKEAGATASDYATLQQDYDLQRAAALTQANSQLKSFLDGLTTGASSGLSARDRESSALAAFNPFAADINAGKPIDQAAYQTAAQSLLDVERELNGSTAGYFDTLSNVTALTTKVLNGNGSSVDAALNLNPYAVTTTPVTDSLAALQAALLGQGGAANALLAQIAAGIAAANLNGYGIGGGGGGLRLDSLGLIRNF